MAPYDRSKVVLNNPQQSALHSRKCQVEKVEAQLGRGPEPRYLVLMSLTRGELHALNRTLESRTRNGDDPVDDLYAYLKNALERDNIADKNGDF